MNQTIDVEKLKAAAERLEWVLNQYPGSNEVQSLLHAMTPLITKARAEEIKSPTEKIPCSYLFSDGAYRQFLSPNVEEAYVNFAVEMRGGRTRNEIELYSQPDALWQEEQGKAGNE